VWLSFPVSEPEPHPRFMRASTIHYTVGNVVDVSGRRSGLLSGKSVPPCAPSLPRSASALDQASAPSPFRSSRSSSFTAASDGFDPRRVHPDQLDRGALAAEARLAERVQRLPDRCAIPAAAHSLATPTRPGVGFGRSRPTKQRWSCNASPPPSVMSGMARQVSRMNPGRP
jgi:hypothetical protein